MLALLCLTACRGEVLGRRQAVPAALDAVPHRHAGERPNIVFIVLDAARADRMSFNGYRHVTSPFIDRMAEEAVVYRNAHSVAPWTLPSHMSMFTGLLPGQHGATWRAFSSPEDIRLEHVLSKKFTIGAPDRLLGARLAAAGYQTIGFSNNAWVSGATGLDRGFEHFYEMWRERRALRNGYAWLPPAVRTTREVDDGDAGLTLLKFRQHLTVRGLREPFFLFFNFIDPHFPYSPPLSWRYAFSEDRDLGERIARFGFSEIDLVAGVRAVDLSRLGPFYDAELLYADFVVGRLLEWLRLKEYYDETLVIITSDHGELLGEGGGFSHQLSVAEEVLRVPLVIKYPKGGPHGVTVDDPLISNLDVYETILAAAGIEARPDAWSADLSKLDRFDRDFLIAEYDYSLPYLQMYRERNPAFPLEAERVVRRVVYTRAGRYTFVEGNGAPIAEPPQASDSDRARAAAIVAAYVKSLAALPRAGQPASERPLDKETLERLKSLGYAR